MDFRCLRDNPNLTVIFDTDMCCDVDDVGALYLLLAASKRYGFRIGGIAVNVNSEREAAAVGALLREAGMDIPVGVYDGENPESGNRSAYVDFLAGRYGGVSAKMTAAELYARVLDGAEDGAVAVVSVGFFNNLNAARRVDPALFDRKVGTVVAMAGRFDGEVGFAEFNIREFPEDSREFIAEFGGEIIFGGFEIGYRVMTDLTGLPADSLIAEAYRIYTNGTMRRESWDPLTVDFAIAGECESYALSERGVARVLADLSVGFTTAEDGRHRYIILRRPYDEMGKHISGAVKDACTLLAK